MLALCRGHRMLSGIAVIGTDEPAQRAHVPALCLLAASLELPGATAHMGALPAVEFLPLDFAAAAAVEQAASSGLDWWHAHAVYATAAAGEAESLLLTATPDTYAGTGVWAVDIGKP
ncbi:PIN domain-containing protein [Streptomyces niveus]|uniref:hypothetical protein n=1 Tax=Streptomyces niveus TaxID=193462 RepID=UPI00344398BC